jgi:SAM-dependent methyltransferase
VCGRKVRAFTPLPDFYHRQLSEAGWPYALDDAETCNHRHYSCPHCGAADRDRLLAMAATEFLSTRPGPITVIDFAPAEPLSRFMRHRVQRRRVGDRYRTADLTMPGVDDRVDITDLACYPTGSVDLFLCSLVLEHVLDDRRAMRELCRILRPGGRGLLLVPIVLGVEEIDEDPTVSDSRERWRRFGQNDHVRLYSKRGFVDRLTEAGFAVREHSEAHFGAAAFADQGIESGSTLYVAEKPTTGT